MYSVDSFLTPSYIVAIQSKSFSLPNFFSNSFPESKDRHWSLHVKAKLRNFSLRTSTSLDAMQLLNIYDSCFAESSPRPRPNHRLHQDNLRPERSSSSSLSLMLDDRAALLWRAWSWRWYAILCSRCCSFSLASFWIFCRTLVFGFSGYSMNFQYSACSFIVLGSEKYADAITGIEM